MRIHKIIMYSNCAPVFRIVLEGDLMWTQSIHPYPAQKIHCWLDLSMTALCQSTSRHFCLKPSPFTSLFVELFNV